MRGGAITGSPQPDIGAGKSKIGDGKDMADLQDSFSRA
jgi:hypothetical protein